MAKNGHKKRGLIFRKTDGHCGYCGRELDPFGDWHIDHMLPQTKGGTSEICNLIAACGGCNSRKKDKTIEEFRAWILGSIADDLRKKWLPRLEYAKKVAPSERIQGLKEEIGGLVRRLENETIQFYIDDLDID